MSAIAGNIRFPSKIDDIIGLVTRALLIKAAATWGLSIVVATGAVLWFSIVNRVPFFEVMEEVGGGIAVVAFLACFVVLLLAAIVIFPSIFRMLDPSHDHHPAALSGDYSAQIEWNRQRWSILSLPGMVVFFIIAQFIEVPISTAHQVHYVYACKFLAVVASLFAAPKVCRLFRAAFTEWSVGCHPNDRSHPEFVLAYNLVVTMWLLVYLAAVLYAVPIFRHDVKAGEATDLVLAYTIPLIPVIALTYFSYMADRKSGVIAAILVVGVVFVMLVVTPGAPIIVAGVLRMLVVGGGFDATLYVKTDDLCNFPAAWKNGVECNLLQNNIQQPVDSVKIVFISKSNVYAHLATEGEKLLSVPRREITKMVIIK